jgi:hypothetical protein
MRTDGGNLIGAVWGSERLKRIGNEDLNHIHVLRQTLFHSLGSIRLV